MSGNLNKPTRLFTICTAPIVVPAGEGGAEIAHPTLLHEVRGCELKYVSGHAGEAFFHILDAQGSVVFASPVSGVLWSKQENLIPTTTLKLV